MSTTDITIEPANPDGGDPDPHRYCERHIAALLDHIGILEDRLDECSLRSIEARNPGIEISEVKRQRRADAAAAKVEVLRR